MPGLDGLAFLERYKEMGGAALVIMMSAYGDDEAALEAIRRGAYDFIAKPFRADQVLLVVRKAIEREGLRREVAQLHDELVALRAPIGHRRTQPEDRAGARARGQGGTPPVHGAHHRGERHGQGADRAAHPRREPARGEAVRRGELRRDPRGAARERAVRPCEGRLHRRHGRAAGAVRGGATSGTLFLDELGDLPLPLQVKLLRALQEGEVRRVGDNASRTVDVRVVAATARDLEADVAEGRFRADLYYRINVVRIHLPALRERSEDIPELVRHFVDRFNRRLGLHVTGVTAGGHARARRVSVAGQRARARERHRARDGAHRRPAARHASSFPRSAAPSVRPDGASPLDLSVKRRTEELERALIKEALERTRGNRTRAAKLLDLSHRALLYKIRDYGLGE